MSITHIFFDVGGVLGTNGWDTAAREEAVKKFGLDGAKFADRHQEAVGVWESGGMSLDEYLRETVFHQPRKFTPDDFIAFMHSVSKPFPATIKLAGELARSGRWRMATLNNESAELNVARLRQFGLTDIFSAFYSSCWLGALKPARKIYELALAISAADPATSVFIDDRERNLDPARSLGMQTIHYTGVEQLRADLAARGVAA